nr:MAG TPA_asm: hypothetical protein [Caudoviricetes sp.]
MDAVEFLDKVDRLSKRGSPEEKMRYNAYRVAGDNTGAVEYVEQLDDMHPIKTRQSEFLKLFPNAQTDSGCLNACPMNVFGNMGINCNKRTCLECKKEFWLQEVEDV